MSVSMRLARRGKRNDPFYHVVVADNKKPRDGSFLEILGTYDPCDKAKLFKGNKERIEYWISKGAIPSETVSHLIKSL